MGIDSVAIKTFNSSGSQSVCRANEADDTKLIESEFLTKCTTEYINGSGMSFVMGNMDITAIQGTNPIETFAFPSEVDAISEIIFQMRIGPSGENVSSTFILDLIKKIELKLGNLVVQTIYPGDIYARNLTEFTSALNTNTYQVLGGDSRYANGSYMDFAISIPFTGRGYGGVNKSFLQAGAITNGLKMKFYYNKLAVAPGVCTIIPSSLTTGVCVFTHAITGTEKNFISNNIINRPVNTSYSVVQQLDSGINASSGTVTIDLSPVNINVSHILITMNQSVYRSSGEVLNVVGSTAGTSWTPIIPAGSSVSSTDVGVVSGWLYSAELVLGNDRTGNVPGSCLSTEKIDLFRLSSVGGKNIYIMKLAGNAFSSAGVSFQRLNNKKLVLKYMPGFTLDLFTDGSNTGMTNINVTCCGTQIQSTVGGSISFSA